MKKVLVVGRRDPFDNALNLKPQEGEALIKKLYPPESIIRKRFFDQKRKLMNSGYDFIITTRYDDAFDYMKSGRIDLIVIYQIVGFKREFLSLPAEEKYRGVYQKESREITIESTLPEILKITKDNGKYIPIIMMAPDLSEKTIGNDRWTLHRSVLEDLIVHNIMLDPKGKNLKYSKERELSRMIAYVNNFFTNEQYLNNNQTTKQ